MTWSPSTSDTRRVLVALCSAVAAIFAAGMLVVLLLNRFPVGSLWLRGLLASAAVAMLAFPAVYVFAFRPIRARGRYLSIFEHAPHGIYQSRPDGIFITANLGLARILGYDSSEALMAQTRDAANRLHAPSATCRTDFLRELALEAWPAGREFEIIRRDGSRRWVSESAQAIRDKAGVIRYYEGTLTDITDRVEAQRALLEGERSLRETQAIAGLGSYTYDVPADRWSSSVVLDSILGIPKEFDRSVGGWTTLIHPADRDRMLRYFRDEVLGARGRFDAEYRIVRHNDGEPRWVHGLGLLEYDTSDRPARMIGTVQDITDRMRAEERLREQAELLDHAQDAIMVRDMDHRVTYWNNGAERLYGWSSSEAVGRVMNDLICKEPDVAQAAQTSALSAGEWTGELQQVCRDGREVSVDSRWTVVRDLTGAPRGVLVINTDTTGRKKLERQFLRTQRLESIGLLAGGIAHDLNNVLAPIMMAVDLLKLSATDDDRPLLDAISASTQRGAAMVKGVLSFARGMEGHRVDVQVRHLMREIETIARETFPKNVQLRIGTSRNLWTVLGDPTQLHQVLLNLCINARDALPDGGPIFITAENVTLDDAAEDLEVIPGRYVVIQVEDKGTGIPQGIIDKIFDPFFTTKEVGKGTGLGLSTSLTIVKGHGGFVRVSSEPGGGSRFRIYLPAIPDNYDLQSEAAGEALPRGEGETIMIVDDEAAVREITRQTLEVYGYRVLLASHGADAVAQYTQRFDEIAVVVTDLLMPVMDGAATIRALMKLNPTVRIVAVSGSSDSGDEALPESVAGQIPILSKPYSPETLLQALRRVIARERSPV